MFRAYCERQGQRQPSVAVVDPVRGNHCVPLATQLTALCGKNHAGDQHLVAHYFTSIKVKRRSRSQSHTNSYLGSAAVRVKIGQAPNEGLTDFYQSILDNNAGSSTRLRTPCAWSSSNSLPASHFATEEMETFVTSGWTFHVT